MHAPVKISIFLSLTNLLKTFSYFSPTSQLKRLMINQNPNSRQLKKFRQACRNFHAKKTRKNPKIKHRNSDIQHKVSSIENRPSSMQHYILYIAQFTQIDFCSQVSCENGFFQKLVLSIDKQSQALN